MPLASDSGPSRPFSFISPQENFSLFTIVMTNASFCLFICAFVFASNSGHVRINDFLLFFTPLLLLNYFLFNFFYSCKKVGAFPAPPSVRSLKLPIIEHLFFYFYF